MRKRIGMLVVLAAVTGLALAVAPVGSAKNREDVLVSGTCTKSTSAKLKLSEENGRIEVEFEVDQNRVGVRWNVVLRQNGRVVRRVTRVTGGRSGSFEARLLARNGAGADRFTAAATRSGETCRAAASL
jgi:hypothetical protein